MSEELNQTESNPVAPSAIPVKRPRGRPPGSKNKPKPEGYIAPERKTKKEKTVGVEVKASPVTKHFAKVAEFVASTEDNDDVVASPVETADISE